MSYKLEPVADKDQWEEFVAKHAPHSLFQSWLWGEVQKKLHQTLYRYGLFDGARLVGIAQIIVVKAKRGTFLHVRHGPIFITQNMAYWQHFLSNMVALAKKEHAWFIRVSPLVEATSNQQVQFLRLGFHPAPIHAMDAEHCWVLDIDKSEEELLAGMRKTTRYEIRRAMKMGVTVSQSQKSSDLVDFFTLYKETSSRHGFVGHTGIKEEFDVFTNTDCETLFVATHEHTVLAAALIMFYNNQAIYHHGASISTKVPASYLIQWEAIREAKKRGMKLYNFWGIAPEESPNHPWSGITLFKKGFGGREVQYTHAQDYAVNPLYIIPKTIEGLRKKLRGY